jgi:hypothetical protein
MAFTFGGAVFGTGEQLLLPHHVDHLRIGVAVVGLHAVGEDLPQQDTERPDVGLGREPWHSGEMC